MAEAQQFHYRKRVRLSMPSNVRWGTTYEMVKNVIASLDAILQVVRDRRILRNEDGTRNVLAADADAIFEFLSDAQNVKRMKEIESVLKPIAVAIKLVEGDVKNTSAAYARVIDAIEMADVHTGWIEGLGVGAKEEILTVWFMLLF